MRRWAILSAVAALVLFLTTCRAPDSSPDLLVSADEIALITLHGPWPGPATRDASNRVSGSPYAIEFGRRMFFDRRLSGSGTIACATCHQPDAGWSDGLPRSRGLDRLDRNSLSLYNVGGNRWFGWDGRTDSLWAHSIGPILDPREMGADPAHVVRLLASDLSLATLYGAVFGEPVGAGDAQTVLVNLAKALAAFQETIVSGRTAFDDFRDALARGDRSAAARYPKSAQRGAALFVGRGKCNLCHVGPAFTNGEFADAGVPYFIEPGRVDAGRQGGIAKLKASPFNLAGRFNDDARRSGAWAVQQVAEQPANFGAFKVPSLRNLTRTAPYLHDGSRATLEDVVRHYSDLDIERLHADGEKILEPFRFTREESDDLVAFLKTLSD